jgi:hypothetical protein
LFYRILVANQPDDEQAKQEDLDSGKSKTLIHQASRRTKGRRLATVNETASTMTANRMGPPDNEA